jgi:hypothetical protein
MTLTVHEASSVHANLVEAFDAVVGHLEHRAELADCLNEARIASAQVSGMTVSGRSAEPVDDATVARLREFVTAGRSLLAKSDVGRKVSRFKSRIEDADRKLGGG